VSSFVLAVAALRSVPRYLPFHGTAPAPEGVLGALAMYIRPVFAGGEERETSDFTVNVSMGKIWPECKRYSRDRIRIRYDRLRAQIPLRSRSSLIVLLLESRIPVLDLELMEMPH
jgi:hypothetical protein